MKMLSKSRFDTFRKRVNHTTLAAVIVISGVSPSVAAGGGGGHGGRERERVGAAASVANEASAAIMS